MDPPKWHHGSSAVAPWASRYRPPTNLGVRQWPRKSCHWRPAPVPWRRFPSAGLLSRFRGPADGKRTGDIKLPWIKIHLSSPSPHCRRRFSSSISILSLALSAPRKPHNATPPPLCRCGVFPELGDFGQMAPLRPPFRTTADCQRIPGVGGLRANGRIPATFSHHGRRSAYSRSWGTSGKWAHSGHLFVEKVAEKAFRTCP